MSGPIQFGGLASGIDSNAIIAALLKAEQIPINNLQAQKTVEQGKKSLLSDLSGLIDSLKAKADELSSSSGFLANTVTPSQEGIATFNPSGGALDGSYTLEVLQLARASRYELTAQADPNADLNGVEISFDIGTGAGAQSYTLDLDPGSSSLNEVAEAINEQLGDVARATVINTGTGSSPSYTLVLESADTGLDAAINNLSVSNGNLDFDVEQTLSTAQNAQIVLNDLTIERSTNEFSDVVQGLSFTVEATTEVDSPITFNVGVDDEAVLERLGEFVDAYNEVMDFINGQSDYSEENGAGGPLFGDPALRSIRSTLSGSLFDSSIVDANSAFGSLGLLGLDIGVDGRLSIDKDEVSAKLAEDPEAFADFFTDLDGFDNGGAAEGTAAFYQDTTTDTGLFSKMVKRLDQLLDDQTGPNGEKLSGLLKARQDTLQANMDRLDDRIEALEFRLEGYETQLIAQFAALEETIGGLNAQQSFLGSLSTPSK